MFSGYLTISSQTFSDAYENSNTTEYKELASKVSRQVRWSCFFVMFSVIFYFLCLLKTLLHCTLSFSSKVYMVKCACCQSTMWCPVCKVSGNLNNSTIHGRKLWVVDMKGQSERLLFKFFFFKFLQLLNMHLTLYDLILTDRLHEVFGLQKTHRRTI